MSVEFVQGVRSGMSSFRIRWTYTNLDGSNKGKTIAEKVQCNKRRKQLWPEKFQNKTNGVTPRRWLHFCNPELRKLITKWIGTEDWVLNTDKLAGLRKLFLRLLRMWCKKKPWKLLPRTRS
nr:PREDICTED: glycogen phosphorylase-like isoform X3 [Daucus carota subsp. sativus]